MALEHSDISRMLEVARVAARLAGQRAMEELKYVKTSIKRGDEIVTEADRLCQRLIIDRIKETYPDHGFIAEEGDGDQMLKQPPRAADPIWWVIDPIDGSNNYAHSLLCFTVSIAVVYQGRPIVGVIFEPATESMFTAAEDADAQLNASRITVSDEDISKFAGFGIDSHFKPEMAGAVNEVMRLTKFRNLGSAALQLAYVAKGALVGTLAIDVKLWDIAAGTFLIETAGGIVTDLAGNGIFPIDLKNYTGQKYNILAANKKTHAKFLKIFKT
jgi:myo-inositol-1(or 4)-monophosphatase